MKQSTIFGRVIATLLLIFSLSSLASDWTYTVRKGDTLWDLCLKYTDIKDCWMKIGDYNGVKYPKTLAPATRIRFPAAWLKDKPAHVEVYHVIGIAEKQNGDTTSPLNKGDKLNIETLVSVKEKSTATLLFADGSLMIVTENSEVSLDTLSNYKDTGMVDSRVHLKNGNISITVPKRTPRSRFEVQTPSAVAAVRGTKFRIGVNDAMRNEVLEGEIVVSNTSHEQKVPKGFGLVVKPGDTELKVQQLLTPPTIRSESGHHHLPFTLRWENSAEAKEYAIQVFSEAEDAIIYETNSYQTNADEKTNEAQLALTEGCHTIALLALDENGLKGLPSKQKICTAAPLPAPINIALTENNVLQWEEIEKSDHYTITFSKSLNFDKTEALTSTENNVDINKQTLGNKYKYVKIAAVGKGELRGASSEAFTIQKPKEDPVWLEALIFLTPFLFSL